ncbi:CRISPR associated protein of unknown function [Olavius algarvensis Delta 1 endosymbiont]|nr:CRISPR associated protein of unknown function [Olavius algarvensis Delta 1 endosymbiont]
MISRQVLFVGSSPRLWGTLNWPALLSGGTRFIPTPVGNTLLQGRRPLKTPVHPHACGEHMLMKPFKFSGGGSSPRLWGTPSEAGPTHFRERFIPTPVGNTNFPPRCGPCSTVHPHACGEHSFAIFLSLGDYGSSPRLWGTREQYKRMVLINRFIPTPVGNTLSAVFCLTRKAVHPHACGEHSRKRSYLNSDCGSSPRLWGTHERSFSSRVIKRFIPTPVGNTVVVAQPLWFNSVHPHACGEHAKCNITALHSGGSSPRLWGTLRFFVSAGFVTRFIPTPVGNTQ